MANAMSAMTNERLVQELISAAYTTGYCAGKDTGSDPRYAQAIAQRELLRRHILLRLQGTCGLACHTDRFRLEARVAELERLAVFRAALIEKHLEILASQDGRLNKLEGHLLDGQEWREFPSGG